MFEKDSRKLTRKNTEKQSPRGGVDSTVYGELKLSEKLSLQMLEIQKEKDSYLERIE